jgi:hypothetical protein
MSLTNSEAVHPRLLGYGPAVQMFGELLRFAWITIASATVIAELIPVAGLSPAVFYTYKTAKIALFFLLGYCTPLAFHRFDKLNWGLLLAGSSAVFVEVLQGLIGNGHRFSFVELTGKVLLIGLGFAFALDARYERAISIGKWRLRLTSNQIPNR